MIPLPVHSPNENRQAPEKPSYVLDQLEVHSVFKTIQGEGPFAGRPAVFVRLAGCNLQCPGCDTDYTSNRDTHNPRELADKVDEMAGQAGMLVVITGGEPFRQKAIYSFIRELNSVGLDVQVETNGTVFDETEFLKNELHLRQQDRQLSVVCSPKTPTVHGHIVSHVTHWKYIIPAPELWVLSALPGKWVPPKIVLGQEYDKPLYFPGTGRTVDNIYLQPEHTGDPIADENAAAQAAHTCMEQGFRLSLQLHKYIGLP